MENKIRRTVPFLMTRLAVAIAGVNKYGVQARLLHTMEENLPEKLEGIVTAANAYNQGKVVLGRKRAEFRLIEKRASNFVGLVRDVLKPLLGSHYNHRWASTGWVGSLAKPRTADALLPLLVSLKGHFTTNPTHQVHALKLTAEEAGVMYETLRDARNAVTDQLGIVRALLRAREGKARLGEKALRMLLTELHKKLDPLDSRWVEFGFKKPGARSTPEVPENVSAVVVGDDAVAVKWDDAPRATHFWVWKRVVGVEQEFVLAGSRSDHDCTIENLPRDATVEIAVSAVNRCGKSRKSKVITVQTAKGAVECLPTFDAHLQMKDTDQTWKQG